MISSRYSPHITHEDSVFKHCAEMTNTEARKFIAHHIPIQILKPGDVNASTRGQANQDCIQTATASSIKLLG